MLTSKSVLVSVKLTSSPAKALVLGTPWESVILRKDTRFFMLKVEANVGLVGLLGKSFSKTGVSDLSPMYLSLVINSTSMFSEPIPWLTISFVLEKSWSLRYTLKSSTDSPPEMDTHPALVSPVVLLKMKSKTGSFSFSTSSGKPPAVPSTS